MGIRTPGCGDDRRLRCNDCGHEWTVAWDCMSRYCPHCFTLWAAREAGVAKDKIRQKQRAIIVHAVISVEAGWESVWELRPWIYEIARRKGMAGAAIVAHAWRDDKETGEWYQDGYLHYHLVGELPNGRFKPAEEGEPFVWKVVQQREGTGIWAYRLGPGSLFYKDKKTGRFRGVLYYMLEHCAVQHGRHALTWMGRWWRDEFGRKEPDLGGETATPEPEACPSCGSLEIEPVMPEIVPVRRITQSKWDQTGMIHVPPRPPPTRYVVAKATNRRKSMH